MDRIRWLAVYKATRQLMEMGFLQVDVSRKYGTDLFIGNTGKRISYQTYTIFVRLYCTELSVT